MEDLLAKALEEVYEQEFEKYKVRRIHIFSLRHRRMMRDLFKQLENKSEKRQECVPESDEVSDDTLPK